MMICGSLIGNLSIFGQAAESEPNDTEGTATPITKGIYTTGMELSSPSDVDYYSIYLNQGDNISLILWNYTTIDFQLIIKNAYMSYNGWANCTFNYTSDIASTYFIRVSSINTNFGQYCLNISDFMAWDDRYEPNNGFAQATPLDKGQYKDLVYLNDDYYRTTCQAGTNLSVYIYRQLTITGKINLTIRDGAYAILAQHLNIVDYGAVNILTIPQTGIYYIILSSESPFTSVIIRLKLQRPWMIHLRIMMILLMQHPSRLVQTLN